MAITIHVRLFSDMVRYHPNNRGRFTAELPEGSSVQTLLESLGAAHVKDLTIGVGGDLADRTTVLRDGDTVELITPMVGG